MGFNSGFKGLMKAPVFYRLVLQVRVLYVGIFSGISRLTDRLRIPAVGPCLTWAAGLCLFEYQRFNFSFCLNILKVLCGARKLDTLSLYNNVHKVPNVKRFLQYTTICADIALHNVAVFYSFDESSPYAQSSGVKPTGCQFILRGHRTEIIIIIEGARHSVDEFFLNLCA